MTRMKAVYEHRKMWRWIAAETLKRKSHVLKQHYLSEHGKHAGINDCFLCEYDIEVNTEDPACHCPVVWDGRNCLEAEYARWSDLSDRRDYVEAAFLAVKIANLPTRKVGKSPDVYEL